MVPIRHSQGDVRSISVRPLARLARCASVESVLDDFAEIAREKGIELCSVRFARAGLQREFKAPQAAAGNERGAREITVSVEGGQTQLIVKFHGLLSEATRCEIEDVAHLAAHRLELLAEQKLRPESAGRGREASSVEELIGDSAPMRRVKDAILTAARGNSTVLITGESGTGKEIAARAIHRLSSRANEPFIPVNCGAFTESLLESELFGYVKGAFTGATANRKGLFEAASKGTIFLDEIGEMTLATQVRLLRVLQERKVRPVGAQEEREVDVRVIAATNRDLQREVGEHRFRHDLYYRLRVLPLEMPPLRQHQADIPLLVRHLLVRAHHRLSLSSLPEIEEEAMGLLCRYGWPGNVRELETMLERLSAEAGDGGVITTARVRGETAVEQASPASEIEYVSVLRAGESLDEHIKRQELALYQLVRDRAGGSHTQAARRLGVERTALYHRLERARQQVAGTIARSRRQEAGH